MEQGYAHITVILDRTGSMESVKDDTIGGFNRFLADQKAQPGRATMTLVQFDSHDPYEVLADMKPLAEVADLSGETYVPRAMTPLLDAIGRGINDIGAKLGAMAEDARPERIVFVILTDGHENASREFTKGQVLEMIRRQTDDYQWKFVYLGANQDAIAEAGAIGIKASTTMTYAHDAQGTKDAFVSASRGVAAYRCCASTDEASRMAVFNDDDREKQARSQTGH